MQQNMRLAGQTAVNDFSSRSIKNLMEYTAGDIMNKGNKWMSDSAPNADVMTRKGDQFDGALKRAKMILCISLSEIQMRMMPYKVGQKFDAYRIYWYTTESKGNEDYWRVVVFHQATVQKVTSRNTYYEVLMKIDADVEYFDQTGSRQ